LFALLLPLFCLGLLLFCLVLPLFPSILLTKFRLHHKVSDSTNPPLTPPLIPVCFGREGDRAHLARCLSLAASCA
jgi:hypothetical protein